MTRVRSQRLALRLNWLPVTLFAAVIGLATLPARDAFA
jgi:hypothetical protein